MCPNPVVYIREDVHDHISNGYSAKDITDGWVAKLESNDNPCIETAINSGQLFNYMYDFQDYVRSIVLRMAADYPNPISTGSLAIETL